MITLYSKKNCGKCQQVKNIMKDKNIEYIEKDLENPDNVAELVMNNVTLSEAPVLEHNGVYFTNSTGLLRCINGL